MIWVATWNTESGDQGIAGYWKSKPKKTELDRYMASRFPEDYESETLYYTLEPLTEAT